MTIKIIHIVNFLNTQPQYNLNRFLTTEKKCEVDVLHLPSIQPSRGHFKYEANFYFNKQEIKKFKFFIKMSIPYKIQLLINYMLNFIVGLIFIKVSKIKYNFGIGETNFGGFFIYILKIFKRVEKSIFMNGDVIIFKNRYLGIKKVFSFENLQYKMKKIAFKNDLVWFVSDKIYHYDESNNLKSNSFIISPGLTVNTKQMLNIIENSSKIYDLAYIGRLDKETGIDLLINTVSHLNDLHLGINILIIGGSPVSVQKYKAECTNLGILERFNFLGIVESREKSLNLLGQAKFGFAMYEPSNLNQSKYTENGKIVDYIQCGLPVIVSRDFEQFNINNSQHILEVEFTKKELALRLTQLLSEFSRSKNSYNELVESVIDHGNSLDYKKIYEKLWIKINTL